MIIQIKWINEWFPCQASQSVMVYDNFMRVTERYFSQDLTFSLRTCEHWVWWSTLVKTELGRQRQVDPWSSLASLPPSIRKSQVNVRDTVKTQGKVQDRLLSDFHVHMYVCTHTHSTQTCSQRTKITSYSSRCWNAIVNTLIGSAILWGSLSPSKSVLMLYLLGKTRSVLW